MKVLMAAFVLFAFCGFNTAWGSMPGDPELNENYALLKMVEECDLVVAGRVSSIDYVVRESVLPDGRGALTTDITVSVDQVLKGKPNGGEGTVKFMILGGRSVHPETGKRVRMSVSGVPEFTVDEEMLVFLKQGDPHDPGSFARNFPHGRHELHIGAYGKRAIKNGNVNMLYGDIDNPLQLVEMPLDLAVKLGKASQKDKSAAVRLENVIKAMALAETEGIVTLDTAIIDNLKRKAQRIIDAPPPPKQ